MNTRWNVKSKKISNEAKTGNSKNDSSLKGNSDTSVILEAVADMRQSLEKKDRYY